jgi:hypothetical protein
LWDDPSKSTALDEIEKIIEQAHFEGRITFRQRRLFMWALRKAREVDSAPGWRSQCGGPPVEEL